MKSGNKSTGLALSTIFSKIQKFWRERERVPENGCLFCR